MAIAVSVATGFLLWLGTPLVLLRAPDWRRLVPGAAVTAVLVSLFVVASAIYVPILMTWSSNKYGLIGVALSLQSWLVVMGFVVVAGASVGGVITRPQRLSALSRRATSTTPERS